MTMTTFSLLLVLVALASAWSLDSLTDSSHPAKAFLSKVKRQSFRTKGKCSVDVIPYPLNGIRVQQANDKASQTARSYYDSFSIRQYFAQSRDVSQFKVGIENKTPVVAKKNAKIHFYDLLFTTSLRVRKKESGCRMSQPSYLGFVELVETDTTWHRSKIGITQLKGKNLVKSDLQYVMTKSEQNRLFANDSAWSRTIAIPVTRDYIVPLKYESAESIKVDSATYRHTENYEKLIEKKIFLVQTNLYNEVTKVLAGVDVMLYVNYKIMGITRVPQFNLTESHGLIKQISNPEKYASIITNLHRKGTAGIRDRSLTIKEHLPNSIGDTTLNPLLKGMHIYTK